jgi:hypothetical protein
MHEIWFVVVAVGITILIAILCARVKVQVDNEDDHLNWNGRW